MQPCHMIGIPMCALPSQPSQHVGLTVWIRRPEPALGTFRGHVEQNRIRLPEHEFAVLEGGHFLVRIESSILRSELVATTEIDHLKLEIENKMILECDDSQHARRRRKEIKLHSEGFSLCRRLEVGHNLYLSRFPTILIALTNRFHRVLPGW